jgi:hypothetical protein
MAIANINARANVFRMLKQPRRGIIVAPMLTSVVGVGVVSTSQHRTEFLDKERFACPAGRSMVAGEFTGKA